MDWHDSFMGSNDENKLSEIVDIVKSWIPRRKGQPANMSRDFWMPDESCRVCYECDSQFNIFIRKHHCRLCGRVFCASCTANSVPSPSDVAKNGDKIKVCNYCFKQWEQRLDTGDSVIFASGPGLSLSPSSSLVSSHSSCCTCNNGSSAGSAGYSSASGSFQHVSCAIGQSSQMDSASEQTRSPEKLDHGDQFASCRSDDDDEGYPLCRPHSEAISLNTDMGYDNIHYSQTDPIYELREVHKNEENTPSICDMLPEKYVAQGLECAPGPGEEANLCNQVQSEPPPLGGVDGSVFEAVDYENNGLIWLPPDPEDGEDEIETLVSDDDEGAEKDATGEWGYLRSNSLVGECRIRDRSNEEHKTAMKQVVDEHFRALITQLLETENIPATEHEDWLDIITTLSWEAASLLKPDTSRGGGMDPGGYVKVKCVACGNRNESMVVKGVVCKKNVAHRRMASKVDKARLLLLGGALEYQRVANHLSSFDTLLQQEMDHLKMAVAKISAQHPDILLVEKSVSRYAQDYLLAKNISLVLNIKRPLLERIARCTGGEIVPSIDNVSSPKLGYCDSIRVEKFLEDLGSAGQGGKKSTKTLMFFEDCPRPLGCTILLKGASEDELKKVKDVVHYGVFAAYHLALETSFLADEGASLPEFPLKSPLNVAMPNRPLSINRSISIIRGDSPHKPEFFLSEESIRQTPDGISVNRNMGVKDFGNPFPSPPSDRHSCHFFASEASGQHLDFGHKIDHSVESGTLKEEFPPSQSDHHSILVSLSTRCVQKHSVCERAHLHRIKYYRNFDEPLGRYLRDHLFDQGYQCRSCEMPSEAHVHCYTHQQGSLTISVNKLQELFLPGESVGKIWMWHRCLQCPRVNGFPLATKRVVLSDAAWGLSFGKFLELSFSNHAAASRVASCGHYLHRDCLRFYGFGRMVACFRYAPIIVHSVYLPPSNLEFNYCKLEWIQKEFNEVQIRADLLFTELLEALHQMSLKVNAKDSGRQISELELMLQKEKKEFEVILVKSSQPEIDILEINRLKQQLILLSYVWDQRLTRVSRSNVQTLNCSIPKEKPVNSPRVIVKPDITMIDSARFQINSSNGAQRGSGINRSLSDRKGTNQRHSFSTNLSSQSNILEMGKTVRRARSLGHFPVMEYTSDNLILPFKNRPIASPNRLSPLQSPLPAKGPDDLENPSSWVEIPFSVLYRSFKKALLTDSQKLGKIYEYKPVHVLSFTKLVHQGGARSLLPTTSETVVPICDDEPTSIISYALLSKDYQNFMSEEPEKHKGALKTSASLSILDSVNLLSINSFEESNYEPRSLGSADESILSSGSRSFLGFDYILPPNALHARVSFSDDGPPGKVKYAVTCYFAKQFDSLRRMCFGSEIDFIRSLSRCKKWGAQGGKSNVFFAKTLDDRFIIKQVTKTELESFIKFAPSYFKYLLESIGSRCPICLAKILGIYQVTSKHLKGGKETKMDVLVMENLHFGRNITRVYDLKGSSRSRYNPDSSGSNKVLLDQNLIEAMPTSPIFLGTKAKRLLERAVWNDTSFLASIDVMDYSLLVGVDEEKHELVVGIIDFMRQYTWDKHLETWVKASGILGGPKNTSPTVISPIQYKKRFRKAMSAYFLMVPDQWPSSSSVIPPSGSQADLCAEKTQDRAST